MSSYTSIAELKTTVCSILWIENDVFLVGHNPSSHEAEQLPSTEFHLITRQTKPRVSFMYQKIPNPAPPFGMNRFPPYYFSQRLRNFPPSLQELIVVASSASADIGLFTKSEIALAGDLPADKVTNVFTTTLMADDSRRAQLPIPMTGGDILDTSPIGVAIDLSSMEKVLRPLPAEEMDESSGPLPALMVLNNEGVLSSWWVVYTASIKQSTTYPGLVAAGGGLPQLPAQPPAQSSSPTNLDSSQGDSTFRPAAFKPAPFAASSENKPSAPAFGIPGSASSAAAFGSTSNLGGQQSPWAHGGTTSIPQSGSATFGATASLGQKSFTWGAPASSSQASGSVFGQPGGLGMRTGGSFSGNANHDVFRSRSTHDSAFVAPSSGGFASFAKGSGSGFASAASQSQGGGLFGDAKPASSLSSGMETDSIFGGGAQKEQPGLGSENIGFTLGSTFKGDGTSKDDMPRPTSGVGSAFFGTDFGMGLDKPQDEPQAPQIKEAEMAEDDANSEHEAASERSLDNQESTTPSSKLVSTTFEFPKNTSPSKESPFKSQADIESTPDAVQKSAPTTFLSEKSETISTTPQDTPKKPEEILQSPIVESPLNIKPEHDDAISPKIDDSVPDHPLPPDIRSKDTYSPGETSQSSASASKSTDQEAPLPPDFLPEQFNKFKQDPQEEAASTADDEDSGFSGLSDEGSGIDVANEISSNTDPTQTPKVTPGSSFGAPFDRGPSAIFTQDARPHSQIKSNSLFGEVGKSSIPYLPPPSKTQASPRSPSPVRSHLSKPALRPETGRSLSAPSAASKALSNRKAALTKSSKPAEPRISIEEQRERERDLLAIQRAQKQVEEEQELSDKEDERVREELATEVEGTTLLEPFLAHQDYIGSINKPGLPGQVEKVYRDINSMIDTIGLNARSLEAFIKGHGATNPTKERTRFDLEARDWRLNEIGSLSAVESQIAKQLETSQVQSVESKIDTCCSLQKDIAKLQAKNSDITRITHAQSDSELRDASRSAPLSPEQAYSQHELRKRFMEFQKLLADAESNVTVLKAALVSCETSTSRNGVHQKKPTVEAVMNTIMKMTSMIEKRSGDIDVLEAQMRKIRISSSTANGSGREGSPLAAAAPSTPRKQGKKLRSFNRSLNGSKASPSARDSPMRVLSETTDTDVQRYQAKVRQRKMINGMLKEAVKSRELRIRSLEP